MRVLDIFYRYPIYHIPMGRTIKDLSTCFLTYHTLSSSFQGIIYSIFISLFCHYSKSIFTLKAYIIRIDTNTDTDNEDHNGFSKKKREVGEGIHVPPFGLATYKMQGDLWTSGRNGNDHEKLVSLLNVAGCWLKQLNVQHHDFNYFMGYRHG